MRALALFARAPCSHFDSRPMRTPRPALNNQPATATLTALPGPALWTSTVCITGIDI